VLEQDTDVLAHRRERELPDVVPVDADRAGVRVLEAEQELRDGRLPGAARTDDRHELARLHAQRDALERRPGGARVAERHPVQLDGAARSCERSRTRPLLDGRRLIEHLEHTLGGCGCGEDRRPELAELADGAVEQRQVREEREHPTD
jgi:hypothetical protein